MLRQEAIYELTVGEAKYAEKLGHILRVYADTMLKSKWVTVPEHRAIFGELAEIHKLSCALDNSFSAARTHSGIPNVGEIFSKHTAENQPAQLYAEYCTNLAYAKHTLRLVVDRAAKNKDTALSQFLARASELPWSMRQQLPDLLDLPRRRIARYPLLLSAVRKYTSKTDSDLTDLDCAIEFAQRDCETVNTEVRERGFDKVVAIQESIDMTHAASKQLNLIDDQEPLLLQADATLKDGKTCKVFLFRHLFFITKESPHDPSKMKIIGRPIQIANLVIDERRPSSFKGRKTLESDERGSWLVVRATEAPALMKQDSRPNVTGKAPRTPRTPRRNGSSDKGRTYQIRMSSEEEKLEWVAAINLTKEQYGAESMTTSV